MMTNQKKEKNSDKLTFDRIQKISKSMEGRCNIKSNNNNSLDDEDKKVVLNIFEEVYSVDAINSIFGKMLSEKPQITNKLVALKSQTNDPSVDEDVDKEIKELNDFSNLINEINSDSEMINNISINIRKITESYFGFNKDDKDCENSILIMGLIKALLTVSNSTQFSEKVKHKMITLIFKGIMQIHLNDESKPSQPQSGGEDEKSTYKKIQQFLSQKGSDIWGKTQKNHNTFLVAKIYEKINPQKLSTDIVTCIVLFGPFFLFLVPELIYTGAKFFKITRLPQLFIIGLAKATLFSGYCLFKLLTFPFKGIGNKIGNWVNERTERKKRKKADKLMLLANQHEEENQYEEENPEPGYINIGQNP
jgi:hypothetical protein